MKLYKKEAVVA